MPVNVSAIKAGDDNGKSTEEKKPMEDSEVSRSSPRARKPPSSTSPESLLTSPYAKAFRDAEQLKAMLPDAHGMERSAVAQMARQLAQTESLQTDDIAAKSIAALNAAKRATGKSDSLQDTLQRLAANNRAFAAALGPSYSQEQMRSALSMWRQVANGGVASSDALNAASMLRGLYETVATSSLSSRLSGVIKQHFSSVGDTTVFHRNRALHADLASILRQSSVFRDGATQSLAFASLEWNSQNFGWLATLAQAAAGVATRDSASGDDDIALLVVNELRTALEGASRHTEVDDAARISSIAESTVAGVVSRTPLLTDAQLQFVIGLIVTILIAMWQDFSSAKDHTEVMRALSAGQESVREVKEEVKLARESASSMRRFAIKRESPVRDEPRGAAKRIGTLPIESEVEVLEVSGMWYWVRPVRGKRAGREGWVSLRNLRPVRP